MAGSLSTASLCTHTRRHSLQEWKAFVLWNGSDLAVCIEIVCRDLQGDFVFRMTFQLVRDEASFLYQKVCSHNLLP